MPKFTAKFAGPFLIIKQVFDDAYKLVLSVEIKVHSVFHVSLLKEYFKDSMRQEHNRSANKCCGLYRNLWIRDWTRTRLLGARHLIIQARTSMLAPRTHSNLWFIIRFSYLPSNSRKEIHNSQAGMSDTTFYTYVYAALCM